MKAIAFFAGILVLWVVLTQWVLPWFGVPTCCSRSGSCGPSWLSCPRGDAPEEAPIPPQNAPGPETKGEQP